MENNDSVCYVGKINEVKHLEGCDNIMYAKVNDWGTIVKKDSVKVGDLVGVAITDAVLSQQMVDRLAVGNYLRKGNRVRTVKLKEVYSECLVFSVEKWYKEGQDLMGDYEVVKYEEPVRVISTPRVYFEWSKIHKRAMWKKYFNYRWNKFRKKYQYKSNPNFNIYFKFPNFKNVPNIFTEEDTVVITRKIHGSNFRCGLVKKAKIKFWVKEPYEFVYGSHRVEKGSDSQGFYSTNIWMEMVTKYALKQRLKSLLLNIGESVDSGIILYGEVFGEGVQGDYTYGKKDRDLVLFDIEINGIYITWDEFIQLTNIMRLPIVDKLYEGKWSKEAQDQHLSDYIEGTKIPHEGVVVKCITGDRKKIAKVINPQYHIYAEKNNIPDGY